MGLSNSDISKLQVLESIIKKSKGLISPADIAAESGYPLYEIKDSLNTLMERYLCRINMDPNKGSVVLKFEYPLRRRDSKSFKEILFNLTNFIYKIFKLIYKASLGVLLVAYTLVFAIAIIAMSSKFSSDDDDNPALDIVFGIFRAIAESLQVFAIVDMTSSYHVDTDGYGYRKRMPEKNKGKNFIQSVFHFVFGPDRPKYDPINDTKEAIAFIRTNNGKISSAEIIALTGADYDTAELKLAEYSGKFGGEINIDSNGTVVSNFYELMEKVNQDLKGGKIEYYKNEVEPPYEFTGNTSGKNAVIVIMNSFNLIMSCVMINMFPEFPLVLVLGIFPLIISSLYFIIPVIRIPKYTKNTIERENSIIRKKIIGLICDFPDREFFPSDFEKISGINSDRLENMLLKIVGQLQGLVNISNSGKPVYTFPRLAKEMGK